jgi:cytochrome c peroxidase
VARSKYAPLWEDVWASLSFTTPEEIALNYGRIGLAIAAYENSIEVNPFSSKYDEYLAGRAELTPQEARGLELFNGKAMCSACHPSAPGAGGEPPLFTDFTFDNLGVPKNPENPFYRMDQVYLDDGTPINPAGAAWVDPLGRFLGDPAGMGPPCCGELRQTQGADAEERGQAAGQWDAEGLRAQRVFKSLEEVVHFYNTRDVEDWPAPEVAENVNTDELGDLGLSPEEEAAIVAFMKTLTDGYGR